MGGEEEKENAHPEAAAADPVELPQSPAVAPKGSHIVFESPANPDY